MPAYQGRGIALPEIAMSGITTIDVSLPVLFKRFWLEVMWRLTSSPGGNPGVQLLLGTGGVVDTTAANYDRQSQISTTSGNVLSVDGAGGTPLIGVPTLASDTANLYATGKFEIMNPFDATIKTIQGQEYNPALSWVIESRAIWKNTGQINILRIVPPATPAANSFVRIYGEL